MTRLLINIDHVATLRNARRETFPDPIAAARECLAGGAHGIVFHLREDRRHITDEDVRRLKSELDAKLDFELSTAEEIVSICIATQPELATLVPERREEVTTEGGLDVIANRNRLESVIPRLFDAGIAEVALFVDPDLDQIDACAASGANGIELHTGDYANASNWEERQYVLGRMAAAAERAHQNGLRVHAGHGLDLNNYPDFGAAVPHLYEVSIGFAVIARALFKGIRTSVSEMKQIVESTTYVN
ncbi:MAG: pyridoxine 5'-phosphate synthase [Bacteroidetes bacterium]|nr:pyridoxine 5'-phosphate synthase [Bacteroidota bacterium]MDA1333719.1 pyridoxine 5'-phosphate synthase [Bacteroidota bacterium]